MDDPGMKEIVGNIRVASVAKKDSSGTRVVYELSQSSIAAKKYPLQRKVNVVVGNIPELLGTGFVNFMYRSKASRIFLKAGLVPEKMPERQVKIID